MGNHNGGKPAGNGDANHNRSGCNKPAFPAINDTGAFDMGNKAHNCNYVDACASRGIPGGAETFKLHRGCSGKTNAADLDRGEFL